MINTWASGSIELLDHAEKHINQKKPFDKRIAYISIDNAVEIAMRTFLELPAKHFKGNKPSRKDIRDSFNNFSNLLELFMKYAGDKFVGIESADIEFYHRLRNQLYHAGTGLAVDDNHLDAYFTIAKLFLEELFNIDYTSISKKEESTVASFLLKWNKVEKKLQELFYLADIDNKATYKWEEAMSEKLLNLDLINQLTELRIKRNSLIHSTAKMSENELDTLLENTNSILLKLTEKASELGKK